MAPRLRKCCFYGPTKSGKIFVQCIPSNENCAITIRRAGGDLPFIGMRSPVANCGDCKKAPLPGFEQFTLVDDDD